MENKNPKNPNKKIVNRDMIEFIFASRLSLHNLEIILNYYLYRNEEELIKSCNFWEFISIKLLIEEMDIINKKYLNRIIFSHCFQFLNQYQKDQIIYFVEKIRKEYNEIVINPIYFNEKENRATINFYDFEAEIWITKYCVLSSEVNIEHNKTN